MEFLSGYEVEEFISSHISEEAGEAFYTWLTVFEGEIYREGYEDGSQVGYWEGYDDGLFDAEREYNG